MNNETLHRLQRVGTFARLDPLVHSLAWVRQEAVEREAKARDLARVIPDECFCGMWSFRHTESGCPGVSG